MEYRILGKTGLRVSAIALGCEGFVGKSSTQVKSDFDFAISQGVNFVDLYSSDPEVRANMGAALSGRRNDFIIQGHLCTVWENEQYLRTRDPQKTRDSFQQLLKLLQTDYIDIGMIHYVDAEEDFQTVFGGDIIQLAQQWKSEGKIRHIGMSSHNPVVAYKAVESGLVDVLMFSINPCYDMQPPTEDCEDLWSEESYASALQNIAPERERLYELCESRGVGIDVMKVYGGGDLLSAVDSPLGRALTPAHTIEYALTRPAVAAVMIGCKTTDELSAALHWCEATRDEKDYAAALTGLEKFSWKGHCMYCGHCAPCTAGIEVASVNKFYKLSLIRREIPETVREHYKTLSHHASECVECGACMARCPFEVDIIKEMRNASQRFGY